MNKPIIHGETVFKPVNKIPEGKRTSHKMFIAGHSETGHNHVVMSDVEFDVVEDMAKQVFLEIKKPAKVVHKKSFDKHETLTLEPGLYQISRAQEYDPFQKVMRDVWD